MNKSDDVINSYVIKTLDWIEASAPLIAIRTEVFMREQNVPAQDEWDGKDESARHFLVYIPKGEVIACARLLKEQDAQDQSLFHIGRVAVCKHWREQGIGFHLMQTVMAWCANDDKNVAIYLHAQSQRKSFYQALGFVPEGEEFMDAGIPHIAMWHRPTK